MDGQFPQLLPTLDCSFSAVKVESNLLPAIENYAPVFICLDLPVIRRNWHDMTRFWPEEALCRGIKWTQYSTGDLVLVVRIAAALAA
jgi:hypothetical protein